MFLNFLFSLSPEQVDDTATMKNMKLEEEVIMQTPEKYLQQFHLANALVAFFREPCVPGRCKYVLMI